MRLSAGTQLGPYEVVDLLGAGAMGEVYRARDTRLRRQVALKVLPPAVSEDVGRLHRFQQEARAAGALNHPNIVAIHDVGEDAGSSYVVSELLEGETLRERMAGHALAPRKALDFAMQIARGIAAAHERGIVHRDLKPENVFVTRDGSVKILDFGLAKLDRRGGFATLDEEDTTSSLTEPGTVLGTVGYMSPEQVRGADADHRSDIFSFGAILYEMLTGRRAFRGKSAIETMNAILKEEPPQITDVNADLPPGLERIVTHCLEKNPHERFQSARDLAFDLEALSHVSTWSGRRLGLSESPWQRARPALIGALLLALPVAGFAVARLTTTTNPPEYKRLTFRRGLVDTARFAPDNQVIYSAAWDGGPRELYSVRTDAADSRSLGLPAGRVVAVPRTGEMGVLLEKTEGWKKGTLARAPLSGGVAREMLEGVEDADATADGSTFAIVRSSNGRSRLEYPVGTALYQTAGHLSSPRISPSGEQVALLEHPLRNDDRGSVVTVDRSGKSKVLTADWASLQGLAWKPDGGEVWFTGARVGADSALHAVTLSGAVRVVTRAPGRLVLADIAPDGRVLMQRVSARMEIKGRRGGDKAERDLSWFDFSSPVAISGDGKTLLFYESGEGGGKGYGIYARGMDGSVPVRLGEGRAMGLSADGKWVLALPLDAPPRLMLLPTGAGEAKTSRDEAVLQYQWAGFFPDGKHALVLADVESRAGRFLIQDLETGRTTQALPDGVIAAGQMPISPDGTAIIAYPPESETPLLYPVGGGDPRPIPGLPPGFNPMRFTADGKALYLRQQGAMPIEVHRLDLATGAVTPWNTIAPPELAGIPTINSIIPSPDGQGYAYTYTRRQSELYVVDGLR